VIRCLTCKQKFKVHRATSGLVSGESLGFGFFFFYIFFGGGQAMREMCARNEMEQTMLATHETHERPVYFFLVGINLELVDRFWLDKDGFNGI